MIIGLILPKILWDREFYCPYFYKGGNRSTEREKSEFAQECIAIGVTVGIQTPLSAPECRPQSIAFLYYVCQKKINNEAYYTYENATCAVFRFGNPHLMFHGIIYWSLKEVVLE